MSEANVSAARPYREAHDRFCVRKNLGSALFIVAFSALEAFLGWKELGRALPTYSLHNLIVDGMLIVYGALFFRALRCSRERFVSGLVVATGVRGLIAMFAPGAIEPLTGALRHTFFILWVVAFLLGVSVVPEALRAPRMQVDSEQRQKDRRVRLFLIVLVLAALFLGALLYWIR